MTNNPFLELAQQTEFLWNEYKGLIYTQEKNRFRQVEKLKKLVAKVKEIDFEAEFKFLEETYKPKIKNK